MPLRIALAGNSATWRRGMEAVLSDGGHEVAVIEPLEEFRPGVDGQLLVVGLGSTEIPRPVIDAIEDNPFVPVIVVLPKLDLLQLAEGLRLGAAGVVDENTHSDVLLSTIVAATDGLVAVSRAAARAMAELVPERQDGSEIVSDAEVHWLRSMASGSTVAELAEEWGYSERAMFRNLKSLYVRIGVANRTEALLWASRRSLLGPELE